MSFNILVLGGTQMLGRDFVSAVSNITDYKLTLANRGITNPNLFSNINHITIDRNEPTPCAALSGKTYDFVVDFSCYNPDQFNNTFSFLSYNRYILISTVSVLDPIILDPNNEPNDYYKYCLFKKQVEDLIINNTNITNITILRPPAVYGEYDYTNRFEKRGSDFFWKFNNNLKASKQTGCVPVSDVTKKLLSIIENPQNNRVYICGVD
jgi:hypothetical protein